MTQFDIRIITNSEDGETRVSSLGDLVSALGLGGLEKVFTDLHSSEVTGTETQDGLGSKNDLDLVSEAEVDISGSSVRVESAGVFGLTSCEFDRKTGEHLSTTRPYERKVDLLTISGLVPGTIEDVVVPCPRRDKSKCESCPNREPEDKGLDSGVGLTPDQVANMQHLHGTMFGWS